MSDLGNDILEVVNEEKAPEILSAEDLKGISIDPNGYTVMFHLDGDRTENPEKVLNKMYSAYDNALLASAINDLLVFYNNHINERTD